MVQIFKNFLSLEECKTLTEIAFKGIEDGWMGPGAGSIGKVSAKRYTSRMYMRDKKYPLYVIEISNRIRNFMGVQDHPLILGCEDAPHGSDGVVATITYPGEGIYLHKDPRSDLGWATFRCNVMTQAPDSGGKLYVDDELIDIEVGDLHCYYVSEQPHYVTEVEGNTPRVIWLFGAHRPLKDYYNQCLQFK